MIGKWKRQALAGIKDGFGAPAIFKTDQGSQFTISAWIDELKANDDRISVNGKGRWMDDVFVEWLRRSMKYECVYLHAFDSVKDAKEKIGNGMDHYNREQPHSSLDRQTPKAVHGGIRPLSLAA